MKLIEKIQNVLNETSKQLTAREIAVKINEKFPKEVQEKQQRMKDTKWGDNLEKRD